jgi:hypothetical protein
VASGIWPQYVRPHLFGFRHLGAIYVPPTTGNSSHSASQPCCHQVRPTPKRAGPAALPVCPLAPHRARPPASLEPPAALLCLRQGAACLRGCRSAASGFPCGPIAGRRCWDPNHASRAPLLIATYVHTCALALQNLCTPLHTRAAPRLAPVPRCSQGLVHPSACAAGTTFAPTPVQLKPLPCPLGRCSPC